MEEIIREGKWICPNCDAKNKGSNQKCDSCGAIREENVRFIYEEDGEVISDEEGKKKALAGADWICPFCDVTNPAGTDKCKGCSSARSEGKQREVKELGPDGKPKGVAIPAKIESKKPSRPPGPPAPAPLWLKLGCGGLVFLFIIAMILQSMSYPQALEVTGKNWEYHAEIVEYKTLSKEDWKDNLPTGARITKQEKKQRKTKDVKIGEEEVEETYTEKVKTGTKEVKVGVTDLGNGRFKEKFEKQPVYTEEKRTRKVMKPKYRKDPVFDKWVYFQIDEWTTVSTPEARGNIDKEPKWPVGDVPISVPSPRIGDKQFYKKKEWYEIVFQSTKDRKEYKTAEINDKKITEETFKRFKKGDKFESVISGLGAIKELKLPWEKK